MPRWYVYARGRACGPFARNWADTPIYNGQLRRCGGGLEDVPWQRLSCENRGRRAWALLTVSASCDAEHHVRVLARASRAEVCAPRTDAAGMADAMIEALFPILSGASVLCLPTTTLARLLQTLGNFA